MIAKVTTIPPLTVLGRRLVFLTVQKKEDSTSVLVIQPKELQKSSKTTII